MILDPKNDIQCRDHRPTGPLPSVSTFPKIGLCSYWGGVSRTPLIGSLDGTNRSLNKCNVVLKMDNTRNHQSHSKKSYSKLLKGNAKTRDIFVSVWEEIQILSFTTYFGKGKVQIHCLERKNELFHVSPDADDRRFHHHFIMDMAERDNNTC